ncbi:hypothetical protein Tco_0050314, partial [Tanacetum coccineum]
FAVHVFSLEDLPIACLNKAMAFLTVVASLRYKSNATSSGGTMQADRKGLLNATTFKVKDKWLGNALSLSDQGMQHDLGLPDSQAVQIIIPNNYGSDVISEVPYSETYHSDMENQGVHAMQDFKKPLAVDFTDNESVTAELERYKE